jgi:hypothetical protein
LCLYNKVQALKKIPYGAHQCLIWLSYIIPEWGGIYIEVKNKFIKRKKERKKYLIWNSKILNCIPTNVTFWHSPKPISILHHHSVMMNHKYSKFNLWQKIKLKKFKETDAEMFGK